MLRLSRYLFFVILFIFATGFFNNSGLSAKVSKRKMGVGEVFTYTLKVSGNFSSPELTPPEFKDFNVVSQSQSKSFSLINDEIHMDFIITYSLFAPSPGVFIIEAPQIKDNDTVLKGKPIKIKVRGKPLKEQEKILPLVKSATDI